MAVPLGGHGPAWAFKGRIAALALALVLAANWGWQTWQRHRLALDEAEHLVAALTRTAEYQISGTLRAVAALLDEAGDRVDPEAWPQPHLQAWFHARLSGFPEVRSLRVLDAEGRPLGAPINANGRKPLMTGPASFADMDYFQRLRADPAGGAVVIGAPIVRGDQASIPLARAILGADGGLRGVVVAGIDADSLRDKLAVAAVEDEGGAALLRADALFLARVPGHERFIGTQVPDSPVFRDLLPQAAVGTGRFTGLADGNDKIVAYRSFEGFPLVVLVGVTNRTALAPWREQTLREAAVYGVVMMALLVLATLYDRRAEANRRLLEELERSHQELERQVEERTAHLAASNAELAQFTFIASHDLQEPLRSVSSFLQLLQRRYGGRLDAQADEYIGFAVDGAKRMSALLNDVLAYAQIGRPGLLPARCDTTALARDALASLGDETGAEVHIGTLPAVMAVPSQLHCLFQNLLGNALKYRSPERKPVVAVTAQVRADGWVQLAVTDNGIGIDPQYHDRIFKIFQRLHRREEFEGTGIGLALCRKIVQATGGQLWVESRPGQGSAFLFTLPSAD